MHVYDNVYVSMHVAAGDNMTQGPFTGQNGCVMPSPGRNTSHICMYFLLTDLHPDQPEMGTECGC